MVHERTGGIRQLRELIDEFGDELEADFQQFYGLDLISGAWSGDISPRRALVLAGQLAHEPRSRFRGMASGSPDFIGWGRAESIAADLVDAVNANSVVTVKSAGGKGRKPKPYTRPKREPVTMTATTLDTFPLDRVIAATTA